MRDEARRLLADLSCPSWEIRRDAAEDLGELRMPEAIPHLARALKDPVGAVRFAAANALGKIGTEVGTEQAVGSLIACLDDQFFGVHTPVLEALGNLRHKSAVPYFIRFLRDPDPRVRGVANAALMVTTKAAKAFRATADEAKREKAVGRWEEWWEQNKATFEIPTGPRGLGRK